MDWGGDQVDHGDEGGRVAVSTGPCSGRLKETVETFDAGVVVGRGSALKDGLEVLLEGLQYYPAGGQPFV